MDFKLYVDEAEYLKPSDIIDSDNAAVIAAAESLKGASELDFVRNAYEFVLKDIKHSRMTDKDVAPYIASDVLAEGEGVCMSKAHLLTALYRAGGLPSGLSYMRLILAHLGNKMALHCLTAVKLSDGRWIRLDPSGNPGTNAQFSVDEEKFSFPCDPEKGEEDLRIIFSYPDAIVIELYENNRTFKEMFSKIPGVLSRTYK